LPQVSVCGQAGGKEHHRLLLLLLTPRLSPASFLSLSELGVQQRDRLRDDFYACSANDVLSITKPLAVNSRVSTIQCDPRRHSHTCTSIESICSPSLVLLLSLLAAICARTRSLCCLTHIFIFHVYILLHCIHVCRFINKLECTCEINYTEKLSVLIGANGRIACVIYVLGNVFCNSQVAGIYCAPG
jgi:hypothetical protein